jgi:hypothetical protein
VSGNQQHPDLICEVFILGRTDLIEGHEMPAPQDRASPTDSASPDASGPVGRGLRMAVLGVESVVEGINVRSVLGPAT